MIVLQPSNLLKCKKGSKWYPQDAFGDLSPGFAPLASLPPLPSHRPKRGPLILRDMANRFAVEKCPSNTRKVRLFFRALQVSSRAKCKDVQRRSAILPGPVILIHTEIYIQEQTDVFALQSLLFLDVHFHYQFSSDTHPIFCYSRVLTLLRVCFILLCVCVHSKLCLRVQYSSH